MNGLAKIEVSVVIAHHLVAARHREARSIILRHS